MKKFTKVIITIAKILGYIIAIILSPLFIVVLFSVAAIWLIAWMIFGGETED